MFSGEIFMKMLFFEEKESEKAYFDTHELPDFEITRFETALNKDTELTEEQYRETVVLSVFINSEITEKVISKFKNLMIIATRSTGYNHIDIDECKRRNIAVINVENYGRTSVAQYTIGLMINMVRKIIPANENIKRHIFCKDCYNGKDLSNMTLGVIGTGAIGETVCKIANALDMKVLACDCIKNENIKDFTDYCDFDELLKTSDIITLHLPYNKSTYHLLGEKEFEKMKDGVYIINTSRGELIDIEALYNSIIKGKVKGASLDVLECEASVFTTNFPNTQCLKYTLYAWLLAEHPNVIITPHIAYCTTASVNKIMDMTFQSVKDYFKGKNTNLVF